MILMFDLSKYEHQKVEELFVLKRERQRKLPVIVLVIPTDPYACHKTPIPQIPGRSYCSPCQVKVNAHNNARQSTQFTAALVKKNITVLVPIAVSLQNIDIRFILPDEIVGMLRDLSQFVGVEKNSSF